MAALCTHSDNRLLASLSDAALAPWLPLLRLVELPLGMVLYEGGSPESHVYFPTTAIISPLLLLHNGDVAAMAAVGREGMMGISMLLDECSAPIRAVVQCAGRGFRLPVAAARQEFERSEEVRRLLLSHTQALMTQVSQNAVCNRHHSVKQQLCRWLLLSLDRLPGSELAMTHELIAQILGVRREGVTEAMFKLQAAGVIRYARGHITVLDRAGLEDRACECYEVVRNEYERLLPPVGRPTLDRCCLAA